MDLWTRRFSSSNQFNPPIPSSSVRQRLVEHHLPVAGEVVVWIATASAMVRTLEQNARRADRQRRLSFDRHGEHARSDEVAKVELLSFGP